MRSSATYCAEASEHSRSQINQKTDGSQHHLIGIRPTAAVERTIAGVAAGRDEVLEKAIELINPSVPGP